MTATALPSLSAFASTPGPIEFDASNVTGSMDLPFAFDGSLSVGSVIDSIARRMALPDDVAWALRDDDSSVYLDNGQPVGNQIAPGARVTITPRTHLGGGHPAGRG